MPVISAMQTCSSHDPSGLRRESSAENLNLFTHTHTLSLCMPLSLCKDALVQPAQPAHVQHRPPVPHSHGTHSSSHGGLLEVLGMPPEPTPPPLAWALPTNCPVGVTLAAVYLDEVPVQKPSSVLGQEQMRVGAGGLTKCMARIVWALPELH